MVFCSQTLWAPICPDHASHHEPPRPAVLLLHPIWHSLQQLTVISLHGLVVFCSQTLWAPICPDHASHHEPPRPAVLLLHPIWHSLQQLTVISLHGLVVFCSQTLWAPICPDHASHTSHHAQLHYFCTPFGTPYSSLITCITLH